ncbi:MAG: S1C family serine protease, partial [Pirellulales bacterium]
TALSAIAAAMLFTGAAARAQAENENDAPAAQPANDGEVLPAYWLGLSCDAELPPALRAQLGLPDDQGLIVHGVVKETPAEKAGLKEHDVLLAAAGKPLKSLRDLVNAVQSAQEGELTIDLLRGGKPDSVTVKPVKRPEGGPGALPPGGVFGDPQARRDWIEKWRQGHAEIPREFRMFVPGPGVMLPPGAHAKLPPLPADMSLSVTKQGDEPAKVVVKQGEQTWEATEDKLADLPAEVRTHVEGFLGRHPLRIHVENMKPFLPGQPLPGRPVPNADQRFEQLQKELQRLQEAVERLRKETGEKQE